MSKLEFGKHGIEGLKNDGVDETEGWASLEKVPFAGDDPENVLDRVLKKDDETNAFLAESGLADAEKLVNEAKGKMKKIFDANTNKSATETGESDTQNKEELINQIISAMTKAGEFSDSGIDISRKVDDMNRAKDKLNTYSVDVLKYLLSTYQ